KTTSINPGSASFVKSIVEELHRAAKAQKDAQMAGVDEAFRAQVHAELRHLQKGGVDEAFLAQVQKFDFTNAPLAQFQEMHKAFMVRCEARGNEPLVHFVRKKERVEKFLMVCIGGRYYWNGLPCNTRGVDIYAIDRYGNLLSVPSTTIPGDKQQY